MTPPNIGIDLSFRILTFDSVPFCYALYDCKSSLNVIGVTMKKTIFAASALLTLVATSAAFAQQGGGGGGITFESLDTDGDGIVTKEEFKENFNPPGRNGGAPPDPEMVFARVDADGNGEISAEEYENRPRRGGQQPPPQ
jgi:hypothetical protein